MRVSVPRRLICGTGIACLTTLLIIGCSSEPTAAPDDPAARGAAPVFATTTTSPTLSGPLIVTGPTGGYSYDANWSAPYVNYFWYVWSCNTLTVASCATTWSRVQATTIFDPYWQRYTRTITADCTLSGQKSFQMRVDFTAFGQQPATRYVVTKRCKPVEP
jgi:hypothetical protein